MEVEQYLAVILKPILKHNDCLVIEKRSDEMGVLLSVTCHKEDMGVVIGKAGETAKALRHLVRIVGMKSEARASVKINEPDGSIKKKGLKEAVEALES